MNNDISLTIRLSDELNEELTTVSKKLGFTKLALFRLAIWDFLDDESQDLDFCAKQIDKNFRLVLKINQATYDILEKTSRRYNQSFNTIITTAVISALKRYSKYL